MKISHHWLEDYFEKPIPAPEKIAELLTMHAFEVESVEKSGKDTVLDVKILPDRSHDCLSHRGIALEVALLSGVPIKDDIRQLPTLSVPESNVLKVEVEDTKLCKRFSALVIENVEVKESPKWLSERLEAIGQRSINNIVDATNYVMFALGQPLHAYDRALLTEGNGGWKIVARKAKGGEKLLALDNKEYMLTEGQLAIVDGNSDTVLGIAGIKGGKASEISKHTKDIVIEAANFEAVNIRKTAKAIGLRTDASVRFENEITPELTTWALKAVSDLIFKIAGTDETQAEGMVDVYPRKVKPYKVGVSLSEIRNTLGIDLSQKQVSDIWSRHGYTFEIVENPRELFLANAKALLGTKYRLGASVLIDSPKEFDCSGLVAYCAMLSGIMTPRISIDQYLFCSDVLEKDVQAGDLIFALTPGGEMHVQSKEWMPGILVPDGIDHVGIMLSDKEVLHTSVHNEDGARIDLLEDFLKIRENRGFKRIPFMDDGARIVVTIPPERLDLRLKEDLIEEIGRIYGYESLGAKPITPWQGSVEIEKKTYYSNLLRKLFVDEGYSEVITHAFQKKGVVQLANPIAKDRPYVRGDLASGLTEALELNIHNKDLLGLKEVKIFEIGNVFTSNGEYTALAFAGGNVDEMKVRITTVLGVDLTFVQNGKVFEANLEGAFSQLPIEPVLQFSVGDTVRFKPFSKYPFVIRDIAMWIEDSEEARAKILSVFTAHGKPLLQNTVLFDEFKKEDKTSLAYHLVFQSFEKTLTDEEVNAIMEKIAEDITGNGWQVR